MEKFEEEYYTWGELCSRELSKWQKGVLCWFHGDGRVKVLSVQEQGDQIGFIVDFSAEIPQRAPIDIRRPERLLISIGDDRLQAPQVLCLRKSFPTTPHTNLRPAKEPASICLFEEPYSDLCYDFSPQKLVALIFDWLNRAAVDALHLPDQPLEPFIFPKGTIIISRDAFQKDTLIECHQIDDKCDILIAQPASLESVDNKKRILFFPLKSEPCLGILIQHRPSHFDDLCELLKHVTIDLKKEFYDYVSQYHENYADCKVIIGLQVPKQRTANGTVESTDFFAFFVNETLCELAKKLDLLTNVTGSLQPVILINPPSSMPSLASISVIPWDIRFYLSKNDARKISRLSGDDPSLLLVGAGALGSQVALVLGRQGFGKWTICDEDRFLPHNLPRHALPDYYLGWEKAPAITDAINRFFNGEHIAQSMKGMFEGQRDELENVNKNCDVLLDFSASNSVLNHLTYFPFAKPCLSGFVNPTAEAGVLIYEGLKRKIHLDDLYQQFFAEIALNPAFERYFASGDKTIAYAGSCRDYSFQIAGNLISLHAATMSAFIKSHILDVSPSIHVWMWNPISLTLQHKNIKTHPVKVWYSNGWTIRISQHVLSQIERFRVQHTPKETGGVLLGKFDLNVKKIYASSMLPAPEDSAMSANCFIRGNSGLCEKINEINAKTRAINYVGEWHTHPKGNSHNPSPRDKKTLQSLQTIMGKDSFPALIVIKGDEQEVYVEVNE